MLALVLGHELQETAPLVFHPDGVEILIVGAEHQHDLGAVQGSEDVRFVLGAQLIFQGDAGEKHPVALAGEGVVHILGQHAVDGPLAVLGGLLVADEDVVGRLLAGDLDDALADVLDGLGLVPVYSPGDGVGVLTGLLEVAVLQDAVKGGAVAGGDLLPGGRVVHILDAVPAQHQPPVGLGLCGEVGHKVFVDPGGLIELVGLAQPVGPAEQSQLLLIIHLGDGLGGAAVFTLGYGGALGDAQVATAHFTFDDRHDLRPFLTASSAPLRSRPAGPRSPSGVFR